MSKRGENGKMLKKYKQEIPLHIMLIIPIILIVVYCYGPMVGVVIAFQDFVPSNKGFFYSIFHGDWVGLEHFKMMFLMPGTLGVFWNSIFISVMKMIAKIVFPLILALLLNEVTKSWYKKVIQTVTFLPYFLSWVILAGILLEVFSPRTGIVNNIIKGLGGTPIYFFGTPELFPYMLVVTDLWKEIGFNTIIFLAALTGIDPSLYEAAVVDGAGRWKQTIHITMPCISSMVVLVTILGLGNVMNAGFDQVFTLYNAAVYSTGDIIDTYTYRLGIRNGQYSLSTAVGLLKSAVSLILISSSNFIANKYSNYRIF